MEFLGVNFELGLWDGELLGKIVAIDTETTYITHPSITPDLVTFQAFGGDNRVYFVDRSNLKAFLNAHKDSTFVFHNAAFDIDVIIKAFGWRMEDWIVKIEDNKVYDTSILYRLWKLGTVGSVPFKHNLKLLTEELLGAELSKDDEVRCNFGDYFCNGETYWEHIPDQFMEYAARDAIATFYCYQQLSSLVAQTGSHSQQTHLIQLVGDIALNRIHKRGIGFDVPARNKMVEEIKDLMRTQEDILASYGWIRGSKGIQERYEYIITDILNLELPKTTDGHISMKAEDLEPYKDAHPFVKALCTFLELEHKVQYIEPLTESRIHPRYDLIKNTGRTGASKPNIQNPPRSGGIRELFVPKEGRVFAIVDYSFIELCTLAQTAYHKYGYSAMRDAINQGLDPHKYYASVLVGKDIKDITKQERQYAKAANFGFPGGLGIEKFTEYAAASYGVNLTVKEAEKMKDIWFKAYPELVQYMKETSSDTWTITGRKRADASYCAAKNTPFQGLAADGAKIALWELEKAGFDPVAFIHDEIICEVPNDKPEVYLEQIKQIMIDAMAQVCPDVKIGVDGHILDRWRKL